jgi:decaprenylphospho-beta-D-ribofuranose 2-oxidase
MLTHLPQHPLRVPIEWLMRASVISEGLWTVIDRWFFDLERPYVDSLFDYTFFMDGNVRARRVAQSLGMPMSTVQQTFMIPFDWGARKKSYRRLVRFAGAIEAITNRDEIPPTLLDILYVAGDEFLLSANHRMDAFAVTLAFETSDQESVRRIRRALAELSGRALRLGGRVHLVKNVHAAPGHLEAMYAHALPDLVRLKRLVDPGGILRNEFLERVFPAAFPPPRAPDPDE